jgi:hypothetical protein
MVKEAVEDYKRHKQDVEVNNRAVEVGSSIATSSDSSCGMQEPQSSSSDTCLVMARTGRFRDCSTAFSKSTGQLLLDAAEAKHVICRSEEAVKVAPHPAAAGCCTCKRTVAWRIISVMAGPWRYV